MARRLTFAVVLLGLSGRLGAAPSEPAQWYAALNSFTLGAAATVTDVRLVRDRVEFRLNGTFYVEKAIAGAVRGAVFIGTGTIVAAPPPISFERDNLVRLLNSDTLKSDFRTAVLRFNDTTLEEMKLEAAPAGRIPEEAERLARDFGPKLLKETGANLAARLVVAMANREPAGFFFAQIDKGKLGRTTYFLDPQSRIPSNIFNINGGEKGLIIRRQEPSYNDILLSFPSLTDLQTGRMTNSDSFNLIKPLHYDIKVDVRDVKSGRMQATVRLRGEASRSQVAAVPFLLNDSLSEWESERIKHSLKVTSAQMDGVAAEILQGPWEDGFTILLPATLALKQEFQMQFSLDGKFMRRGADSELGADPYFEDVYYPWDSTSWYPRHGFLPRTTFAMEFQHSPSHAIACSGERDGVAKDTTRCDVKTPVPLASFAVGRLQRALAPDAAGKPRIEYVATGNTLVAENQLYMLTELQNGIAYFGALFGAYPYPSLTAVVHPRLFGQGLASFLLLPPTARANNKYEFALIAHEISHQWWGNLVSWRSYRDQWLSEGFAEYSAMLYTGTRMNQDATNDLIRRSRKILAAPPATELGILKGHVAEIAPLTLGLRSATRQTISAYQVLTYQKGAMVLRMLHFLLSNPATGNDDQFYAMLKDFVKRYENRAASTEDFAQVAGEHFARSPLGRKYNRSDLNWFFREWVYEARLPSYRLEYTIEKQDSGGVVAKGTVYQNDAGEDWFMPLPLVLRFGKGQEAKGTVAANGPRTPFSVPLPMVPSEVQLDPGLWVLSAASETVRAKP